MLEFLFHDRAWVGFQRDGPRLPNADLGLHMGAAVGGGEDGRGSGCGAVVVLGTAGGIALSFALLKRVETIRRTAAAIIADDLSQRIPVSSAGDDFDRLSQTLNRMLHRVSELMESLRQVSADIAH